MITKPTAQKIFIEHKHIVVPTKIAQNKSGRTFNIRSTYLSFVLHILFVMRVAIVALFVFITSIIVIFFSVSYFVYPLKYKDDIKAASKMYDIDPVLVASVIRTESKFNRDAVSKRGAVGLMQVMPSTADYVADMMGIDEYDLYNPRDNIMIGTRYLRYLYDKFGDTRTVLAAYNAGEGNVSKWIDGKGQLTTTPFKETNAYIDNVLDARTYYRYRLT